MSTGVGLGADEMKVTGSGGAGLVDGDITDKVLAERSGGGRDEVAGLTVDSDPERLKIKSRSLACA